MTDFDRDPSSARQTSPGGPLERDRRIGADDPAAIEVQINGERREIPSGLSVSGLLAHLEVGVEKVAVERNRAIVGKTNYESTTVQAGDTIEIVSFMGGG